MLRRVLIAFSLFCLASFCGAQNLAAIPPLTGRVVDRTATLSVEQSARLEAKIAAFERQKGAQFAVLLVSRVAPESIAEYSLRVVETWRLGRQGVDDGALLLIAKDDRQLRIEVGYGLEGALGDAVAKRIISETISPRFRQGDFYGGIDAGIDAMIRVVGGEPLPPPKAANNSARGRVDLETVAFVAVILVVVVGGVLRALLGRLLAAGVVAGIAGSAASLLLSSLLLGILAGIVAFIAALFAGAGGLGAMGGGRGGWSSGSSWGGGSGGGFSGGGGSFGGGGASGGW